MPSRRRSAACTGWTPSTRGADRDGHETPPRLGISSCLLGAEVRFDGGHKRNTFLTDVLGPHVEWIPVCPEVELGLGTPRPTLHLSRPEVASETRLLETSSGRDLTRSMQRFAKQRLRSLKALGLSGYVLKRGSPSCGMQGVKLRGGGAPRSTGRGLFAEALQRANPGLPIEEEGRLADPDLRDNFIERVFAFRRLSEFFRGNWARNRLPTFHAAHDLQLSAHSPKHRCELERLVRDAGMIPKARFRDTYRLLFMEALSRRSSRARNTATLRRAAAHLKKHLDSESGAELAEMIQDYREGRLPLLAPLVLLRHHARIHRVEYLEVQSFLNPDPKELMLRNHT